MIKYPLGALLALCLAGTALAQSQSNDDNVNSIKGQTDSQTGAATRAWLNEQANGINRGEVEPYRAESAGKAYRAYTDSIGKKREGPPASQLGSIATN